MAQVELLMPKMGESIIEATILKWNKKEGDNIAIDESVLDIATDKVDSEVPSSVSGVLVKILHPEGAVVAVGAPLALIETQVGASNSAPVNAPVVEVVAPKVEVAKSENTSVQSQQVVYSNANSDSRFYSPLVLNIASTEGVSMNELSVISGSGSEGRVTKKDIIAFIDDRANGKVTNSIPAEPVKAIVPQSVAPVSTQPTTPTSLNDGNVEIIEMDRMRKLIADNMLKAKQIAPHVTSFVEADVTNLVKWRDRVKKDFEKREGEKITFTPLFVMAIVKAIKDFPLINVSVDGSTIIVKKDINIGMAAALPNGNLIVPVIKNADRLNLVGLTKVINDLANRARTNKLKPDEIQGATYTFTNVGTFGNVMGTPIIPQPQVGILATGAIRKKPAVIETPEGDFIGIRQMMFLSHSYDHRVVDGALGGSFVRRVADYLEQWDINQEY